MGTSTTTSSTPANSRGKRNHINGIENFWGYAKTKLRRHYGIPRNRFFLYLKEMEFRFNHQRENIEQLPRKMLKSRSLF